MILILRVVNMKKKVVIEDPEFKKKYDILFADYRKSKLLQRNYPALVLLKKILIVLVLVMLHDWPFVELAALYGIFLSNLIILLVARPFKKNLTNAIMIFTDLTFIVILSLISYIESLNCQSDDLYVVPSNIVDEKIYYGWIIIGLFSIVLFLYFLIFLREQINNLIKFFVYLKESKLKYKEYLKNIFKKKLFAKSNLTTQSSKKPSISHCDTLETSVKDLEQIKQTVKQIKKVPETSFSRYIIEMKSRTYNTNTNSNITSISLNTEDSPVKGPSNINLEKIEESESPKQSKEKIIKKNL